MIKTIAVMIKTILFDFGQTLVDSSEMFRVAEKKAQERIFKDIGLSSWSEFLDTYRRIREQFHKKSQLSRKLIWQEVYWYYCRACSDRQLQTWEFEYWERVTAGTMPFPEAESVLEQLAAKYPLGLITNTQGQPNSEGHRIRQFPTLKRYFDVIVVAGEGDIPPKPDPEPFGRCLEKLNMKADEALFVGDDWQFDICGARNAGLHPVWLQHRLQRRKWPAVKETAPIITSLEQVFDLVPELKENLCTDKNATQWCL